MNRETCFAILSRIITSFRAGVERRRPPTAEACLIWLP